MRPALCILIAAALSVAGWYWMWKPELATPIDVTASAMTPSPPIAKHLAIMPRQTIPSEIQADDSPDYGTLLRESTDILSLVEMLHQRAANGEAAAQYWLSRALPLCQDQYDFTFLDLRSESMEEITLDEALQQYATDKTEDPDELRAWYVKCQSFREGHRPEFGAADHWLEESSKGRYALAQVTLAGDIALTEYDNHTAKGQQELKAAKQLAIEALRDGDPEVVMKASSIASYFAMDGLAAADPSKYDLIVAATDRAKYSWMLAACMRGADCSPQADWVRRWCRVDLACQSFEAGPDFIRRATGAQFDELDRRAHEINALIDAKNWAGLEFK